MEIYFCLKNNKGKICFKIFFGVVKNVWEGLSFIGSKAEEQFFTQEMLFCSPKTIAAAHSRHPEKSSSHTSR